MVHWYYSCVGLFASVPDGFLQILCVNCVMSLATESYLLFQEGNKGIGYSIHCLGVFLMSLIRNLKGSFPGLVLGFCWIVEAFVGSIVIPIWVTLINLPHLHIVQSPCNIKESKELFYNLTFSSNNVSVWSQIFFIYFNQKSRVTACKNNTECGDPPRTWQERQDDQQFKHWEFEAILSYISQDMWSWWFEQVI